MFNKRKAKKPLKNNSRQFSKFVYVDLPSGLIGLNYSESGARYLYRKNFKTYEFVSQRAMDSWKLPVIVLKDFGIRQLDGKLGFRDGSLIQNFKDGKIYLVSDAKKRLLTAPLEDYGFDWADVIAVSDDEAQFHQDGMDL